MAKKILIVMVLVIAFLLASIYIFRANIKRYAIQTILKSFPLPNVALANVDFDETTGRLNLEEIKVKSPKGFESEYIMEADSVDMSLGITRKPNLRLDINDINITNPVLYIERSPDDRWNFQEYATKKMSALPEKGEKEGRLNFIREAFAAENEKKTKISLPRDIHIKNGVVHFMDNFIMRGRSHKIDFFPVTANISMLQSPDENDYEKISFAGSCNINGHPSRLMKGSLELYPMHKHPTYSWKFKAYDIPLAAVKPYLDRYTPFVVRQGSFNMSSDVKAVNGAIDGDYIMEFMNLQFDINPAKTNVPFLETSVKKLTLYLTNQRGNVIIDFKQKGEVGGEVRWSLGPIAKRAVGLMAIDTVIDIIKAIEKGRKGVPVQEGIPQDIPPEIIDIFRGIFK